MTDAVAAARQRLMMDLTVRRDRNAAVDAFEAAVRGEAQARIELLEAALARAWQHDANDLTMCGVCGASEFGLWLHPEHHFGSCIVPTIAAAVPPEYRAALTPSPAVRGEG